MRPKVEYHEGELLEERNYTVEDICIICRLDSTFIIQMIEHDVIKPISMSDNVFSHTQINRAMKAWRLKRDLELNSAGVALAMQLLERIDKQETELKLLRKFLEPV